MRKRRAATVWPEASRQARETNQQRPEEQIMNRPRPSKVTRILPLLLLISLGVGGARVAPAIAGECPQNSVYADCAPGWMLNASTFPSMLPAGGEGEIMVNVVNIGASASSGAVTVTDVLPRGTTATSAGDLLGPTLPPYEFKNRHWLCAITAGAEENSVVTCVNNLEGEEGMPRLAGGGGGPNNRGTNLDQRIGIGVKVPNEDATTVNRITIAGGGAPNTASTEDPIVVGVEPGTFRFTNLDAWFSNADGTVDTQAGSHPYAATFNLNLAAEYNEAQLGSYPVGGNPKEVDVSLPPGFVGDPTAVPECTRRQLDERTCPNAAQVGTIAVTAVFGETFHADVYNVVPPAGVPNELGFEIAGNITVINASVRSGSDYGITTSTPTTPERAITEAVLTLWGEPGDMSHNIWRRPNGGGGCKESEIASGECASPGVGRPFLTLPTSCRGPQEFSIRANTWEHQNTWSETLTAYSHDSNDGPTGFTGCELLDFAPTITTAPDTAKADTPTGLTVEVNPPVGGLSDPEGLSTADIQDTTVTLPPGLVINPGQAAGLQVCQPGEDGLTTQIEREAGRENNGPAHCPNASKVGTDEIETPLLPHVLKGEVYVLRSNPPELKLLVTATGEGVNLKLVGIVHLNEQTGQLTTTFTGTPELPFTSFKLSFSGGAQAALDTPTQCGTYASTSDFTPWSSPLGVDAFPTSSFTLTEGPEGSACPASPLPFAPTLTAGSTTDQAGGFTGFSMLLARGDGQQRIERLQFKAPAGLGGMLSSVPLCGEPQAAQGTCSSVSRIGHASVASGPGPYPLVLPQPGEPELPIYLTGPYGSAPFGLSIVTPVLAGPFDLGTIVTRAKIEIDPHTAQITVTTDPLPQVVRGVPTDLRLVDAVIDRPGFMFNPTNCDSQTFSGTAWGTPPPGAGGPGASASISSHFGVGSCRGLEFHPKFSVSTSGRNSKANGANLIARVSYPNAAQGSQANIGLVKVELPKQLPSRLTTLQKACTLAQFESNPAGCPSASFIGHATVHTPELPDPLTGPAIFVSHGGEAFPTLTMVLQGDGVTIDLVGSTFIDKAGITSTTFKTVPDAPFSTFELTLPQGPSSALATNVPAKANYSLCAQKLTMPNEFVGQNGAVLKQTTKIAVTGCAKKRTLTRAQKLTAALKACRKKKGTKRVSCEKAARKRYGPLKAKRESKGQK
jgi:hypothetical protein